MSFGNYLDCPFASPIRTVLSSSSDESPACLYRTPLTKKEHLLHSPESECNHFPVGISLTTTIQCSPECASGDLTKRGRPRATAIQSLISRGSLVDSTIRCGFCQRVFPREKSLHAHMRTHTGERPYCCDFPNCNKAFCQSGQLKTHQRLHSGEKPFICSVADCGTRFTHANRHCPDHPTHALIRDEANMPPPSLDVETTSPEEFAWLCRYLANRHERTTMPLKFNHSPHQTATKRSLYRDLEKQFEAASQDQLSVSDSEHRLEENIDPLAAYSGCAALAVHTSSTQCTELLCSQKEFSGNLVYDQLCCSNKSSKKAEQCARFVGALALIQLANGSYEGLSLGYVLEKAKEGKLSFVTSFTDHSHTSSVKAVAVSCNGLVATGSADETIKLFNMDKRVELGSLLHHQGSVTGLSFFGNSHMFSCSEDGTIAVWQTGSWECLRTLRGHKSAVYSFTIHPSGKLALSCGKDKTLRTWNLMTGHCAYISNLKEAADIVLWSPDGIHYITVIGTRVTIYRFQTGAVIFEIHTDWRISSAAFLMSDLLAIGCEKGMIFVYDLKNFEKVCEFQTGTNRVKTMVTLLSGQPSLVIVSSDGFVQLYHFDLEPRVKFTRVAELSSGFRLLCATARHISTKNSSLVATVSTNIEQSSDADKNSSNIKRKQQLSVNTEKSSKKRKSSDKASL